MHVTPSEVAPNGRHVGPGEPGLNALAGALRDNQRLRVELSREVARRRRETRKSDALDSAITKIYAGLAELRAENVMLRFELEQLHRSTHPAV